MRLFLAALSIRYVSVTGKVLKSCHYIALALWLIVVQIGFFIISVDSQTSLEVVVWLSRI